MSEHDEGTYTCHAVNEIGEAKHNFQVASELQKKLLNVFFLFLLSSSSDENFGR